MAIGDIPSSPQQAAAPPQPIDIEAWTEQATVALGSVAISTPGDAVAGASVTLAIPLDEHDAPSAAVHPVGASAAAKEGGYYRRKEPLRRDSMKRREALLKGKEGSRRRQRWENDRLLNNPYAEPPLPKDWEVHPTYTSKHVPYYLAPLWDAGLKRQSNQRKKAQVAQKTANKTVATNPTTPGIVPKELREKLKRSRGAKGLLMDLEGEVRKFVADWEEKERKAEQEGLPADPDSEDDEIVFVGRNGQMNDLRSPTEAEAIKKELMLFETPEEDVGGSFGRWLVHHIGVYYGLKTWSVTVGNPARREAYIGVKGAKLKPGNAGDQAIEDPTPWVKSNEPLLQSNGQLEAALLLDAKQPTKETLLRFAGKGVRVVNIYNDIQFSKHTRRIKANNKSVLVDDQVSFIDSDTLPPTWCYSTRCPIPSFNDFTGCSSAYIAWLDEKRLAGMPRTAPNGWRNSLVHNVMTRNGILLALQDGS
ncbi:hypothetical protein TW65_00590 [Stemphylium lycopersici]|nr:hypothetical protein TW65_00590 [Stemphylium lycopersici]